MIRAIILGMALAAMAATVEPDETAIAGDAAPPATFTPTAPIFLIGHGPGCVFLQTRVNEPPLIDWPCAEKFAAQDGYSEAKTIAQALIDVRDHRYEEKAK